MTTLQQLSASQTSPEVVINEVVDTLSAVGIFGRRHPVTTGLTWGYYGGRYNGNTVADGTVTLTNSADNYVSVNRSTGAVSVATNTTNWDSAAYARLYKVTTAGGVVTASVDYRMDANGLLFSSASTSPVGRHAVYIAAGAMQPSVSGGCAALASVATTANRPDIQTLNFDQTTPEYAQFSFVMPKSWNEGTVTFTPVWSHPSTTTNFGVVWSLQGVAVGNDDTIDAAYGAAQTSTDTGGTTDDLYTGPESSAITIAGTPASEDMVFFRVSRVAGDGSDTLAVDARLHGIVLYITTDAATDA